MRLTFVPTYSVFSRGDVIGWFDNFDAACAYAYAVRAHGVKASVINLNADAYAAERGGF